MGFETFATRNAHGRGRPRLISRVILRRPKVLMTVPLAARKSGVLDVGFDNRSEKDAGITLTWAPLSIKKDRFEVLSLM